MSICSRATRLPSRTAVPAGVVSVAKAVYLFGDDPTLGADPNIRILACPDKFNFGPVPTSMQFEYATQPVLVRNPITNRRVRRDYGLWVYRGTSKVTAKALLVALAPETKERKSDRIGFVLIELLKDGPLAVAIIRQAINDLEPPISWRTVERVKNEMGIKEIDDPTDKRRKLWKLSESTLAAIEEITSPEDVLEIEEIDVDVPDVVPEEWEDGEDEEE